MSLINCQACGETHDHDRTCARPTLAASAGSAMDPDLGEIGPGHVCKHGVRWPYPCAACDDAAWELHLQIVRRENLSPNAPASATEGKQ